VGVAIKFVYDRELIKNIIKIGWPFAAYAVFQRLYTYLDSVLLSFLAGHEQVGLYQVAFKIIFALQFLPLAFTASLYPAMSAYWQNNKEQLGITFKRAINYLTIISLPIIVGTFLLADKIVLLFRDGYGGAVLPLKIIIISLFFMFLNFPIGSLLNACDKQKNTTINRGIITALAVILNIILIPRLSYFGAGITFLITNFVLLFLDFFWVKSIISLDPLLLFKIVFKSLVASIIMILGIYFVKPYFHLLILIPWGVLLYFASLYLLKGFNLAEVRELVRKGLK